MSDVKITVEETVIYSGTASELKRRYPDDYKRFIAENPDADDRDWLNDCLDAGGPSVFDEVERDLDAWTSGVSG